MSKLGDKAKPAVVKVNNDARAMELYALCEEKGWQVIIGLEYDEEEDITDITKLINREKSEIKFATTPSRNSACLCGSGKQYKRCCGK